MDSDLRSTISPGKNINAARDTKRNFFRAKLLLSPASSVFPCLPTAETNNAVTDFDSFNDEQRKRIVETRQRQNMISRER
mmetsp:Transcript_1712/g.3991  ORF Transcript_1712/g.3991 Transcript_1712/m.3991 type:complete len:80 (+) Transcript_1712:453-692(+)